MISIKKATKHFRTRRKTIRHCWIQPDWARNDKLLLAGMSIRGDFFFHDWRRLIMLTRIIQSEILLWLFLGVCVCVDKHTRAHRERGNNTPGRTARRTSNLWRRKGRFFFFSFLKFFLHFFYPFWQGKPEKKKKKRIQKRPCSRSSSRGTYTVEWTAEM